MANKYYTNKQRRDDNIYYTIQNIKYYGYKIIETLIILTAIYLLLFISTL